MTPKHTTFLSFKYAFEGMRTALKNESHMRVHFTFATITIITGAFLGLTSVEWVILFSAIFYVISLELINTAVEALVDLVSPQIKPKAKIAKDVSAAVVLCAAIYSIVVGIYLFLPKIVSLFYK